VQVVAQSPSKIAPDAAAADEVALGSPDGSVQVGMGRANQMAPGVTQGLSILDVFVSTSGAPAGRVGRPGGDGPDGRVREGPGMMKEGMMKEQRSGPSTELPMSRNNAAARLAGEVC